MKSIVSIAHAGVETGIPQALDRLDGLDGLIRKRHVAIKPNDTWASREDTTACTQADTLRSTIRAVKRYNPGRITVSGGSGDGETDDIFRILGLDRVIEEERVEFFDHNRPPFKEVTLPSGPQRKVMVNPHVFDYEVLISLAQHKVHYAAAVTLTMKNIAMSYPAADFYGHPRSREVNPNRFYDDMHGHIVGMCSRFPIHLGIIAGHPAMTGHGPIGGRTFDTKLVIASRDAVAADAVGAYLLGVDAVRHIEEAQAAGLGTSALGDIDIAGIPLDAAADIFEYHAAHAGAV